MHAKQLILEDTDTALKLIHMKDRDGRTALWHAVGSGQLPLCQYLIESGSIANQVCNL
jgi:hypothetical protein